MVAVYEVHPAHNLRKSNHMTKEHVFERLYVSVKVGSHKKKNYECNCSPKKQTIYRSIYPLRTSNTQNYNIILRETRKANLFGAAPANENLLVRIFSSLQAEERSALGNLMYIRYLINYLIWSLGTQFH